MNGYDAETVAFVGWLIHRSPCLSPVLQEHLGDNLGEVLPHPLMFEIRQWLEAQVAEQGETDEIMAAIQDIREGFLHACQSVRGLTAISFVDDLSPAPHPADRLRRFFDSASD